MLDSCGMLAMLGGFEIAVILLLIMVGLAVAVVLGVVFLIKALSRNNRGAATASKPSGTARLPVCPRCGVPLSAGAPQGLCPRCVMQAGFPTEEPGSSDSQGKDPSTRVPEPTELARLFPQLEILGLLGQGGMGTVYKARQKELDRLVALKVLPAGSGRDPAFAERFTREARALARLNHPGIVAVHDFGQVEGFYYFLMQFIDGPNLRQLMQARKLSPEEALAIVPQVCEALQFAHDEGVVHRDIKPENILLDRKGRVKIADFGIAKILGRERDVSLTGAKDVIGTPHYMAPEQVEHPTRVDHRADIYSLGVVFYEMLTGELPLGKFAVPSSRMRGMRVDVRLDEVVLHALEKEPERRYQHASEVKTDVETIATAPASGGSGRETAPPEDQSLTSAATIHHMVKAPATGLIITGILNWIAIPLMLIVMVLAASGKDSSATPILLLSLLVMLLSSVMIVAGLKMKRMEAYPLAIAGSILAILVTPGNIIGLPVGFWSLVVLCRREVREAFGGKLPPDVPASGVAAAASVPRPDRFWRRFAVVVALVLLALILFPVGAMLVGLTMPALHRVKMQQRAEASHASMTFESEHLKERPPRGEDPRATAGDAPPVVIRTVPESGAADVDPALNEIRVTYSKDMLTNRMWAFCQVSAESFPERAGEIHYVDQRTCVMPVKLQPGRRYVVWLNFGEYNSFRDTLHQPALPYLLVFQTKQ